MPRRDLGADVAADPRGQIVVEGGAGRQDDEQRHVVVTLRQLGADDQAGGDLGRESTARRPLQLDQRAFFARRLFHPGHHAQMVLAQPVTEGRPGTRL
jgi:hypothetical protein